MAKKFTASSQQLKPDPKYNSKLVTKLISMVMVKGKKALAEQIVYSALEMIEKKSNKNAIEVALAQSNTEIVSIKKAKVVSEGKKSIKLGVRVGSTGRTNKRELEQENKIEDVLRKGFGLKRGIDFVFRRNLIQFTNASDVSPKLITALKSFVE